MSLCTRWAVSLAGLLAVGVCCVPAARSDSKEPVLVNSGGLQFEERLVWGDGRYVYGVTAVDVDNDGDLDLSTAGVHTDVLLWHESDGKGNLKKHLICDGEEGYLERHAWGDLNGDKRLDVVIVKNRIGHLIWFESSKPTEEKGWTRHVISTDFMRAYDVDLADLDGDGDLDIAASAYTGDCFSWFENPGKEKVNEPWPQHRFDKAPEIANTRTIVAVDINKDGKLDLLGSGTYGHHIVWYENTGEPGIKKFSKRHIIDDNTLMPTHGHPVDMDGDGDIDVVMAFGIRGGPQNSHQAAWYENVGKDGKGAEWRKHMLGDVPWGFEAVVGDLDGDGDLDVVASGCSGGIKGKGEICWFENSGDPKAAWKRHAFKQYPEACTIIVTDLDADGRLDIACGSESGTCHWWRNLTAKPKR
ncbi:MAG: VCBS repeat-containing protein [Planctomycetaceae bacterium]|nr:VCBS repeat-containing protein [Planctomycetaceae bacterium]